MTERVSTQITLTRVDDGESGVGISSTVTYYQLAATAPTTTPDNDPNWTTTEPAFVEGSDDNLYTIQRYNWSDGTHTYSSVNLSSSYAAAKAARNNFFWHDSSGAHISLLEKAITNVKNVLINATGMFVRNGTSILAQFTSSLTRIGEVTSGHTDITPSEVSMYGNTGTDTLFKTENLMTGSLYRYTEVFDTGDEGTTAGTYEWTCEPTLPYSGFVSARALVEPYKQIGGEWCVFDEILITIDALNTTYQIYSSVEEANIGTAMLTYSSGIFTLTLTSNSSSTYRFNRPLSFDCKYTTTISTSQTQCGSFPADEDKVFKVGNGLDSSNKSTAFSVDAGGDSRTKGLSYICSNANGTVGLPLSSLYIEENSTQINVSAGSVKSCNFGGLEHFVTIDDEEYMYNPIGIVGCYIVSETNNDTTQILLRGFKLMKNSQGDTFARVRIVNTASSTTHLLTVTISVLYAIEKSYRGTTT